MQAMLGSVSGLTVNWTVVTLGHGGSLASHAECQAFLEARTKDKDSNPDLMIRVDVLGSSEAQPKKRGFAPGQRPPRPPLAPLDSLLNAIGITALRGFAPSPIPRRRPPHPGPGRGLFLLLESNRTYTVGAPTDCE